MRVITTCLLIGISLLTGCKKGTFLNERFDDFTAYYNRFYNAKEKFEQGVKSLEKSVQVVNRNEYMPLFLTSAARGGGQAFDETIKKCAELLRGHGSSKWVDDAILMIGKSYFYKQESIGAEQKFKEVIRLGGPLEDEARFWLARTLIASENYDEALSVLEESLQRENLSNKWGSQMRLALGELYVQQGNWEAAIEELEEGLPRIQDRDLAARAQFLLGQIYVTLQDYEKAIVAFDRVHRYKPLYNLTYAATISKTEVMGLFVNAEEGLQLANRMERNDKFYDDVAEVSLLKGRILAHMGKPNEAVDIFEELLYDPFSKASALRGPIHYAIAQTYEEDFQDYLLASAYYDTAAQNIRISAEDKRKRFTPLAITNATEASTTFKQFAKVARSVLEKDSLLWLGSLNQAAFDSVIAIERERKRKEQEALLAEAAEKARQEQFQNIERGTGGRKQDISGFAGTGRNTETGFLSYLDAVLVQDGRNKFREVWGDRPLVPNWRRQNAIGGAYIDPNDSTATTNFEAELVSQVDEIQIDVSKVPRDSTAQSNMRALRALDRYEMANTLFLAMNMPDSAAVWYRKVIDEDTQQPVAQRAYFALAEVQLALGDTTTANRLYNQIVDTYPDSDFSIKARERLGIDISDLDVKPDSLQLARNAYEAAYTQWQKQSFSEALTDMLVSAWDYKKTEVAPQALLAAGQIYTEWAIQDGLDLLAPIPIDLEGKIDFPKPEPIPEEPQLPQDSLQVEIPQPKPQPAKALEKPLIPQPLTLEGLYSSINDHFPRTPYAERAKRIISGLAEVKKNREALEREQADSLAVSPNLATQADSLGMKPTIDVPADSLQINPDVAVQTDSLQTPQRPEIAEQEAISEEAVSNPPIAVVEETGEAMNEETKETEKPQPERPAVIVERPPQPFSCESVSEFNSVFFDLFSKELNQESKRLLKENLDILQECNGLLVSILGYTDEVENSQTLSQQRAESIMQFYTSQGLSTDRISFADGKGVAMPACAKEDPDVGCRRNRRGESIPMQ